MGEADIYIGTKACGCVVAMSVDSPEYKDDTADIIAEWIRDGLTISRTTRDDAISKFKTCKCDKVNLSGGLS